MQRTALLLFVSFLAGNLWAADLRPSTPVQKLAFGITKIIPVSATAPQDQVIASNAPQSQGINQVPPSKNEENGNGAFSGWTLGDKIAAIVAFFAFLQFLGVVATYFVMRDTARRQLRAYINPTRGSIYDGNTVRPAQSNKAGFPYAELTVKNAGATPAYDVVSFMEIAVIPIAEEDKLLPIIELKKIAPFTVAPGMDFPKGHWHGNALTQEEINSINAPAPTHAIFVYGRYEYRDAFNQKHFSNFRYQYIGAWPPPPNTSFGVSKTGNESD